MLLSTLINTPLNKGTAVDTVILMCNCSCELQKETCYGYLSNSMVLLHLCRLRLVRIRIIRVVALSVVSNKNNSDTQTTVQLAYGDMNNRMLFILIDALKLCQITSNCDFNDTQNKTNSIT